MKAWLFIVLVSFALSGCGGVQWQDVLVAGLKFGRCASDAVTTVYPRDGGATLPENPYGDASTEQ